MNKILTLLMAVAFATPSIAAAGPYIGLGIGGARTESSLAELGLPLNLESDIEAANGADPDFSSNDVSFEVAAGWMFGRHFGVEVGYVDFGRATQNYVLPEACNGFGCQSREWTAQMDMTAIKAFLIGSLPLGENFDVYAKLGAITWDADYDGFERNQLLVPGFPIGDRNDPVSSTDDGTGMAAGLGLTMKTDSPFSLRVEFTYYDVDTTDLVWIGQLMGTYTF